MPTSIPCNAGLYLKNIRFTSDYIPIIYSRHSDILLSPWNKYNVNFSFLPKLERPIIYYPLFYVATHKINIKRLILCMITGPKRLL